jgi:hypothetical protein
MCVCVYAHTYTHTAAREFCQANGAIMLHHREKKTVESEKRI